MDAGVLTLCELVNTADAGRMPVQKLNAVACGYYEDRLVGYNRYFAAAGVNEQVDLMTRVWRMPCARAGMYAVLSCGENDGQYRIVQVQHLLNDDGLKITDLTLQRLDEKYELAEYEPEEGAGE